MSTRKKDFVKKGEVMFRLLVCFLFMVSTIFATTRHVPGVYSTIQAGLNGAYSGDDVLVQPGTYVEHIVWPSRNGITLISAGDSSNTVIDGNNSGRCLTMTYDGIDTATVIDGFKFINGYSVDHGGGIYISGAGVKIINSLITNCVDGSGSTDYGGGLYCIDANPVLRNVKVANNSGNGLYFRSSNPKIQNIIVENNSGAGIHFLLGLPGQLIGFEIYGNSGTGIYCYMASPQISNGAIYQNARGIALERAYSSIVNDVDIYQNETTGHGGGIYISYCSPIINNCVIKNNIAGSYGGGIYTHDSDVKISYTQIYGNSSNSGGGLYSGYSSDEVLNHVTITNNSATTWGSSGIHVYSPGVPTLINSIKYNNSGSGNINYSYSYISDPQFVNPSINDYHLLASSKAINAGHPDSIDVDGTRADCGALPYLNYNSDPVWHTSTSGNDITGDGSVSNPFSSIQAGVNFATTQGDCVIVALGTYNEYVNTRGRRITIYGENGPQNTIIQSPNSQATVQFNSNTNNSTVFDGFTVTHPPGVNGNGILVSGSPILRNLIIKGNSSYQGAGIYCINQNPVFEDLVIENNIATGYGIDYHGGGGISCYLSNPVINNVTIVGNQALDGEGGGIYLRGSNPSISNSVIQDNYSGGTSFSGGKGGGLYAGYSSPSIVNTNFINNVSVLADGGDGIHNSIGSVTSISQSNFLNNGVALYNEDPSELLVPNNWWGDNTGPFHGQDNLSGQGDTINTTVNAIPFNTIPDPSAHPLQVQNVSLVSSGDTFVEVNWSESLIGDLASYTVNYNINSSGYPYADVIDVGLSTNYTISSLPTGATIYISVIAYDNEGNSSWYSDELIAVTRNPAVQNLDVGGAEDILHLLSHNPLITFDYFDSMGDPQTSYQLQVSTSSTFSAADMWDTGVVASNANSVYYTGNLLLEGQAYYLRARVATGELWSNWAEITFRMNSFPSPPTQISPTDYTLVEPPVTLIAGITTDLEADEISYAFAIYSDASLATLIESVDGISGGQETVAWQSTATLADNNIFWWVTSAFDGYQSSLNSMPESFQVNAFNDPPSQFNLIEPLNGEGVNTATPQLTWNAASDIDPLDTLRYTLYLITPEPDTLAISVDAELSYQITSTLIENETYSWKVLVKDIVGIESENVGGYNSFWVNAVNDAPVVDISNQNLDEDTFLEINLPATDIDGEELTYTASSSTSGVVANIDGINLTLIPELNWNGLATITVAASDGNLEVEGTFALTVNPVNDAPLVTDLALVTDEDVMLSITLIGSDVDEDNLVYELVSNPTHGVLSGTAPSLTYTPEENYSGEDGFTYITNDGTVDSDLGTSTIIVIEVNDPPTISNIENQSTDEDTPTPSINLVIDDPDSDIIQLIVRGSSSDTMLVSDSGIQISGEGNDRNVVISPNSNQFGTANITITVNDEGGEPPVLGDTLSSGFETGSLPTGWSRVDNDGDGFNWFIHQSNELAHSGEYSAVSKSWDSNAGALTPDNWLITPSLSIENDMELRYWVAAQDPSWPLEHYSVNVSTGGTAVGDFSTTILSATLSDATWHEVVLDLSGFAGNDIHIAWQHHDVTDMYVMKLDDIQVSNTTTRAIVHQMDFEEVNTQALVPSTLVHKSSSREIVSTTFVFTVNPINDAPSIFALISPVDEIEISQPEDTLVTFSWENAGDVDGDDLSYIVSFGEEELENQFFLTDNTITLNVESFPRDVWIEWNVVALDSEDTTRCENPRLLKVNSIVGVDEFMALPEELTLLQNYPNPFNPSTTLQYGLPEDATVSLIIYDIRGNLVKVIDVGTHAAGWYEHVWNGLNEAGQPVSTGLYLTRLQAGSFTKTIKMLYLK